MTAAGTTVAADPAFAAPATGGRLALWASAALAAALAHTALAAWALRTPPQPPAEAAPPAVLIELAPASIAPLDTAPDVPADAVDQVEIPESTFEPTPDLAELDPLPDPLQPQTPELPVTEELPRNDAALAVLPVTRPMARPPAPPPKEAERKEEVREKPQEQKVRAAAAAPAAPAPVATKAAGRGTGASPAKWQSQLMAHLERRKRYPVAARGRREEGVVQVSFAIDAAGNVTSVQIARSSGHASLDAEVLALVRRASPVPPPPPGAPRRITAPVQFRIH